MANHTKLSDQDVSAIAATYGLEILHWGSIPGGYVNSSFLFTTDQGKYVLTFFEMKFIAGAEQNVRLLNHLENHDYRTNRVIPAVGGSLISEYQAKPLVLKSWIPGDTLRAVPQKDYRSIGRAIAALHQIPTPDFLPDEHPYGLTRMPASLNHAADKEYEAWLGEKIDYLESSFPADLPKAFIHGDLFDDNIIYDGEKFQAIIDFGDTCHYPRAYDLGNVFLGACMQDGKLNIEQSRQIIQGYREIIWLSPEELNAVHYFAIYAGAAISAWHYLNTFVLQAADAKSDKYKIRAERTEHIFQLTQEVFEVIFEGN